MNWEKLQEVHDAARHAGVSYGLNYGEASNSWYFTVSSPALVECWVGCDRDFDAAVKHVLEWLRGLEIKI